MSQTDIWTNSINSDFIGLAAVLTNSTYDREIFVINMMRLSGRHTAENVKIAIEELVNRFKFDKSKINGWLHFDFLFKFNLSYLKI